MRQVPVVMAWIVNAFENSSRHAEYFLDLKTGDVKYFSPLDFPEHGEIIKKLDRQPDRYIKLPKMKEDFSLNIKKAYLETVADPYLKGLLEKSLDSDYKFRDVLMEFGSARRKWYQYRYDRCAEFLTEWFEERGIELSEKSRVNIWEQNKNSGKSRL